MDARAVGWLLGSDHRERLMRLVPPRYPDVIAHHVTLEGRTQRAPPADVSGEVVGVADDGLGVQALVVALHGSTQRPDGGVYHITWSIDRAAGREPFDSNAVIAQHGWRDLDPTSIELTGGEF